MCVHLYTSGVCEASLLIGVSGIEGIGVAEINAKTVSPPMKLSRTRIQLTRYPATSEKGAAESRRCLRSRAAAKHL